MARRPLRETGVCEYQPLCGVGVGKGTTALRGHSETAIRSGNRGRALGRPPQGYIRRAQGYHPFSQEQASSPKNKQATARANRERVWTPEMRKKASLSHKGLVKSEESVRKQKESWARTPGQLERARERAARNRPPAGRMVSSEARQRMSEAAKRRCQSRQGFLWVNNGDTAMFVSPDEARTLLAQGWLRGRIRKP